MRGVGHNSQWTKRDCFVLMNCDNTAYWQAPHVEAGVVVVKKTEVAEAIVAEWLHYCRDERIITDLANTCELPNINLHDHRHDQSILTNLSVKYRLPVVADMKKFVSCNAYHPPRLP